MKELTIQPAHLNDPDNLHSALIARYGHGFAQWCMERLPKLSTKGGAHE